MQRGQRKRVRDRRGEVQRDRRESVWSQCGQDIIQAYRHVAVVLVALWKEGFGVHNDKM